MDGNLLLYLVTFISIVVVLGAIVSIRSKNSESEEEKPLVRQSTLRERR